MIPSPQSKNLFGAILLPMLVAPGFPSIAGAEAAKALAVQKPNIVLADALAMGMSNA